MQSWQTDLFNLYLRTTIKPLLRHALSQLWHLRHGGTESSTVSIGDRLTSISPLYSGCGLMFSATSYCDQIGLTFTSDRDLMPEPRAMRKCIDESVIQVKKQLKKMQRKPSKISA